MQIYMCSGLYGQGRVAVDRQTSINHIGKVVGPDGIVLNYRIFQKMGILTPGAQLYKLFLSIITDPYTVLQMKGDRSRSCPDIDGNENDQAVVCRVYRDW